MECPDSMTRESLCRIYFKKTRGMRSRDMCGDSYWTILNFLATYSHMQDNLINNRVEFGHTLAED